MKAGSLNPHTGCSEQREHLAITAPTESRVSNTLSVLRKRVHVIAPMIEGQMEKRFTVGPPSKLSESCFLGAVPVACWWLSLWVWAWSLLGLVVRLLCSAFSLFSGVKAWKRHETVEGLNPAPHIHEQMATSNYGYDIAYNFTHNNIMLEHNAMNNKNTVAHMDVHNAQY